VKEANKGPRLSPHGEGVPAVHFFSEHVTLEANLMGFVCDEDIFGGELDRIVRKARQLLEGMSGRDVHYLLLFADAVVANVVDHGGTVVDQDGEKHQLTKQLLRRMSPVDVMSFLAAGLDQTDIVVQDASDGNVELAITAPRIYAAIALSGAFSVFEYGAHKDKDWLATSGGYHAILAAEALAFATVLGDEESPLAPVIRKRVISEIARKGADARLANDPKQAAKETAKDMWRSWQSGKSRHKSGAAFARHVVDTLKVIDSTKTVERWMQEWREAEKG
jgi:hypothetical protein